MKTVYPPTNTVCGGYNEWARGAQLFPHYKSMGIFPDTQGQLIPQSLIRAVPISNSFEMLWMSLLPARMKKIRSKMKALEWSQESVNRQSERLPDGRRLDGYTISSPCEPLAQVS